MLVSRSLAPRPAVASGGPGDDPRVVGALRRTLMADLQPDTLPAATAASVRRLVAAAGTPGFYDVLANIDRADAPAWAEMGRVQRTFRDAEPSFDPKTRAYSESMRLTLHAAAIVHLARPEGCVDDDGAPQSLLEHFLELHVTAFRENGGWFDDMRIPLGGALAVVAATRPTMMRHIKDLLDGIDRRDAVTVEAADWVRLARGQTPAT